MCIRDSFTSEDTTIAIIEVGGTVGDIESQPFLEAIRQFQHEVGHDNAILCLSLIHILVHSALYQSAFISTGLP